MLVENIIKFEKKAKLEGLKEGIEKGRIEGIEKGRIEGIEKGRIEGIEKGKIEVARNFKKLGIDIKIISQATGLTIEEIEKL